MAPERPALRWMTIALVVVTGFSAGAVIGFVAARQTGPVASISVDPFLVPNPSAVIGAWGKDALDPWIRVDFVQHNVSALVGVWYMTTEGDIPMPRPSD